jgi:hypothetical protein
MNNDEDKNMNPSSMEEPQNDPRPPSIIEEPQMDIQEEPITTIEESKMDIQEPVTIMEEPPIMNSDFPTTSENSSEQVSSQSDSEPVDKEILNSNVIDELNQENSELPVPIPQVETQVEEVQTEKIIDSSASPSPVDSIKVEITKEKLDDLLTKISEETVNYLMLLTKFLERKREFNSDTEKINKTIEDINKIKNEMMKILTETEMTSNGFEPSSSAQKSQYAEMILGALALTAAVSGGKRKKTRKQKKITNHSNTKKSNHKKQEHKTKINKKSIKKSTTKKNK